MWAGIIKHTKEGRYLFSNCVTICKMIHLDFHLRVVSKHCLGEDARQVSVLNSKMKSISDDISFVNGHTKGGLLSVTCELMQVESGRWHGHLASATWQKWQKLTGKKCNYWGGIPPVAAHLCWRVETMAGLTGLLHRTLRSINHVIILAIIVVLVISVIITCRSRPSCCWWAWKEAGGRSVAWKLDPIQASTFFTSCVSMIRPSNWFSYCSMHENVSYL